MTLDTALRLTEILLALAFLQQSSEHILWSLRDRGLFLPRAALALLLLGGVATPWVLTALVAHSVLVLHRFGGPYNGGSDRMGLLVLYCLWLAQVLPGDRARELALGYLGVQVVASYFFSGQIKIINPEWRSGQALRDVFEFSAYPVSESLRGLAGHPRLLWGASWAVMLFEVAFPFSLIHPWALLIALFVAALFHAANACLFGLNRFLWFWVSAYPSLIWLQARLIPVPA